MIDRTGQLECETTPLKKIACLRAPDDSGSLRHQPDTAIRALVDFLRQESYHEALDIPSPINISTWLLYTITHLRRCDRLMVVVLSVHAACIILEQIAQRLRRQRFPTT